MSEGERSLAVVSRGIARCCLAGISCVADPTLVRRRASRANPSYMYLNYVQVVNTRGSSALPIGCKTSVGDPVENLRMLLIPFSTTNFPIPLLHGLAAVRFVLLSDEGLLVGRDLREVMTALLDHRSNADKAVADLVLTLRQR